MADLWSTVATERAALADDLAGLPDQAWSTPSLCAGWTVEDVLAHMTSTASLNPPRFVGGFLRSGLSFSKFSTTGIARHKGRTPEETLASFRAVQRSTSAPPGPKVSWLGETIVHAEDIRRPLGIQHAYPEEAVRSVLDFYQGSNLLLGTKKRIAGIRLRATDAEWAHGAGPPVEGPLLALLMAATGRAAACADLTGEGLTILRSRCA